MLNFKAPILDHGWPPIFRRDVVREPAVAEGRILVIGWRREAGKSLIGRLDGSELVLRNEVRPGRGAAREIVAEIRVAQGGVVNAIPAAQHGIVKPTKKLSRRIGEANTRTKVLIVRFRSG